VTNLEFARTLGRVLRRPAFMPAPAFALRLLLGEMADALLLSGQRAVPRKAEATGFAFQYQTLDRALRAIFGRRV
jgi:NAD dependent epimerase/dehydratase family enzyme